MSNTSSSAASDRNLQTSDITTNNVSSTKHGFVPKSPASSAQFLNGAATPAFATVTDANLSLTDITTNDASTSAHGFAPKLWASAWQSYTPTFANTTLGNGSVAGKYIQIGKTVIGKATFILGTTSAVGSIPTVSLPVTSVSYTTLDEQIGYASLADEGIAVYPGLLLWASTTTARLQAQNAGGTYLIANNLSATVPFTFGNTDGIYVWFCYEAA